MSVDEIESFVVLFSNEEWSNGDTERGYDSTVSQLRPNISFAQHLKDDIHTLSTTSADRGIAIHGLLYVPDLDRTDACYNTSNRYLPWNVTRQANLPPTDFTLIAIAPWLSPSCTQAYMDAAYSSPTRAFIFYLPDNGTTTPASNSAVWDLEDGGRWKHRYQYPVYTIPGSAGEQLMLQLSLYSGNMTDVPFGHRIAATPGTDPRDYVRIFTKIGATSSTVFPSIWMFLLVVAAALAFMLLLTSALMHLIQRRRRQSLRRRVASGEVNLEALGIKRLTVPKVFIDSLPLFTYNSEGEKPPSAATSKKINATAAVANEGSSSDEPSSSELPRGSWALNPPAGTVISDATSGPNYMFFHKFLPYSQPVCAICLDDFESGITVIRELTCGHIFHPECIDTFLGNSSLCPLCKKSALPAGYCPKITNAMVRREINIRRLRSRVTINTQNGDLEAHSPRRAMWDLVVRIGKAIFSTGRMGSETENDIPLEQPQPIFIAAAVPPKVATGGNETQHSGITRQEIVEQRVRELAAGQTLIRDPDLASRRQRPRWKQSLSKAFPGFS